MKEYDLWFNNYITDYTKVVFVDESSFNLHICRSQKRTVEGTRANIIVPTVINRSISLISRLASEKIVFSKVISTLTVNVNIFSAYLEKLCNYLRHKLNNDSICLIFDNARCP
ncbi:hypothetical protein CDIK_2905 [Cucumispora dikerogammari]|nr:hypothetical protein CDIK_2905 [Cucumispora dikerogammari]